MAAGSKKRPRGSEEKTAGIRKGRFESGMDPHFERFNSSISFDGRLYREDIEGSIAHVRMLGRQGIVPESEARDIEVALREILADIKAGNVEFREDLEDVHINVEELLRAKVGEPAGKLHTARSRNDQVILDLRMHLRSQVQCIMDELVGWMSVLTKKAAENIDLVLPGYTHLQRAQPVRLAHHLMAYFQMARRDWERFSESLSRVDEMPLGSAALAGTTFDVDRQYVAQQLGFSKVSENSMDAVSDRDFALEFLFNCSMVMMHLSRLAEELIVWSSTEFNFCSLPDGFCSGSSIMPQKKNPDACELVRGKTGRVYGDLVSLLTTMKALPLTYNKDLQEDKEPIFDAADTVLGCLRIVSGMVPGTEFHGESMLKAAGDPSLAATDLADRLARAGVPFREAHAKVGAMIRAQGTGVGSETGAHELPSPEEMVEARGLKGGTAKSSVREQLDSAEKFLAAARGDPERDC
jgi:argininosuccinate lyase